MDPATSRVRRLNALRQVRRMQERLRDLGRTLAQMEELDDVDAVGVVEIGPGASEAAYAADVLDVIAHALSDAGASRTVKVVVTSPRKTTTTGRPRPQEEACPRAKGSTQTPAPPSARPVP